MNNIKKGSYKKCLNCNNFFYLPKSLLDSRKFCCKKCWYIYNKHNPRIQSTTERKKRSIARIKSIKNGRVKFNSWNKGQTKETNPIIREIAEKTSLTLLINHVQRGLTKQTSQMIKKRSESKERNKKISQGRLNFLKNHEIGHGRVGKREDLGHYCRSTWEANFCRILKQKGIKYKYEPKTFYFKSINYTPDLFIPSINIWVEIKGYMDEKSKQKINRFIESGKQLLIIEEKLYHYLQSYWKNKIKEWEIVT